MRQCEKTDGAALARSSLCVRRNRGRDGFFSWDCSVKEVKPLVDLVNDICKRPDLSSKRV